MVNSMSGRGKKGIKEEGFSLSTQVDVGAIDPGRLKAERDWNGSGRVAWSSRVLFCLAMYYIPVRQPSRDIKQSWV